MSFYASVARLITTKSCPLRTGGRLTSGIEPESPNRKAAKPYVSWATCPPVVPWTPISHVRIKLASAIPFGKPSPPMSCEKASVCRLVKSLSNLLNNKPFNWQKDRMVFLQLVDLCFDVFREFVGRPFARDGLDKPSPPDD